FNRPLIFTVSHGMSVVIQYYLINSSKTWLEAQQHCRRAQGDLASVSDMQDLKELAGLLKDNSRVAFLGLRREWGWSVSDGDDYREGEPVYWNWADNEPSQQDCVSVGLSGKWFATNCSTTLSFFCYNDKYCVIPSPKASCPLL
uniref:C-type lectin domain-containing protein n=1 Tax=Takifugu rubripes TaxID=31033 RepID=A0A674NV19_TAKRU